MDGNEGGYPPLPTILQVSISNNLLALLSIFTCDCIIGKIKLLSSCPLLSHSAEFDPAGHSFFWFIQHHHLCIPFLTVPNPGFPSFSPEKLDLLLLLLGKFRFSPSHVITQHMKKMFPSRALLWNLCSGLIYS